MSVQDKKIISENISNAKYLYIRNLSEGPTHIVIDNIVIIDDAKIFNDNYEKLTTIDNIYIRTANKSHVLSKLLTSNNLTDFTIEIYSPKNFDDVIELSEIGMLLGKMNRLTTLTIIDQQNLEYFYNDFSPLFKLNHLEKLSVYSDKINSCMILDIASSKLREIDFSGKINQESLIKFLEITQLQKLQIETYKNIIDSTNIIKILRCIANSNLSFFLFTIHRCDIIRDELFMSSINENELHDLFINNYKIEYINISYYYYPYTDNGYDDYGEKKSFFSDKQINILDEIINRNKYAKLQKRFAYTKAIMN